MNQQKKEDLIRLKEMIEEGKIKTVVDRSFPWEEMVQAHRFVETGAKQGNLIITVN